MRPGSRPELSRSRVRAALRRAGGSFALLVLTIGAVSFPQPLDRDVGLAAAAGASVRAVTTARVRRPPGR
jgi:hypothetical protein